MDESRLDQDLRALSKRPRPDLPAGFNEMVWSKVRSRETPTRGRRENWLTTLLSALATPQWAAAALALVLLAGWTLGRITAGLVASPTETRLAASVTGEVIDLACYFDDGGSGPDHAECARMCIASGQEIKIPQPSNRIREVLLCAVTADAGAISFRRNRPKLLRLFGTSNFNGGISAVLGRIERSQNTSPGGALSSLLPHLRPSRAPRPALYG